MRLYFLALATLLIVCVGCASDGNNELFRARGSSSSDLSRPYVAPPAAMLQRPGPMVGGPGPGVMGYPLQQAGYQDPGMMAYGPGPQDAYAMQPPQKMRSTQVRFLGPSGMSIGWQIGDRFAENQLTAPARYNFVQGATYRLKLSRIVNREGVTLYPSLHVYPARATTEAYLSHNSVPIQLTDEDLDQILTNNFVTKVVYLPDAKFQDLAAGVEELVSTRLRSRTRPDRCCRTSGDDHGCIASW